MGEAVVKARRIERVAMGRVEMGSCIVGGLG